MRQLLHLLIVQADAPRALAARYLSRWVLPVMACAERVRACPLAIRWAADRGLDAEVAGLWLGRIAPDGTNWLVVLRVTSTERPTDPQLTWTDLRTLDSTSALVDYQGWAVTRSLASGGLPTVPGPFGNIGWMDGIRKWIGAGGRLTPLRTGPHEVVLQAHTSRGEVYFKGLTEERTGEATLTRVLADLDPTRFARTLALDEQRDGTTWWLTAACPGKSVTGDARVASALASLQQRILASGLIRRELSALNPREPQRWANDLVDDDECVSVLTSCFRTVIDGFGQATWIPMDLDPTNVLVDDDGQVRFIDLDDSFLGAAPLAMAILARRCRSSSLYRAYEEAWPPARREVDWPAVEVVAAVIEAWLGWQRLLRNASRGEIFVSFDLAAGRLRARLTKMLHRL
jgi:hypothetical protein